MKKVQIEQTITVVFEAHIEDPNIVSSNPERHKSLESIKSDVKNNLIVSELESAVHTWLEH